MSYLHIACHTTQHDFRGRLIHWIEDGATTLRGRYILNPQRCISDDEHDKKCKRKKIFILIIPHHVKKKRDSRLLGHVNFDGQNHRFVSEIAAEHRLIHVQFTEANQRLSEIDKCRYIRAAIANNVAMNTAVTSYLMTHPQIIQQTFAGLVSHITEQAPKFSITSHDFGYAASSASRFNPPAAYFESTAFAAFLDRGMVSALPKHSTSRHYIKTSLVYTVTSTAITITAARCPLTRTTQQP